MRRFGRALTALACVAAAACALKSTSTAGFAPACTNNGQCDANLVCFLGECRGRSAALTLVAAEVRPPNDAELGVVQEGRINLQNSVLKDFQVSPPFTALGRITQEQDSGGPLGVADATVIFTSHEPPIPDRVDKVVAHTDGNGAFSARLPVGSWDVLILPLAPLPPLHVSGTFSATSPPLTVQLPRFSSFTRIDGTLAAAGFPVTGAQVTAVDADGQPASSPTTATDGGFTLRVLPGAPVYYLQVGPPADLDGGLAALAEPLPSYNQLGPFTTQAPAVNLDLPPPARLQGRVLDNAGQPVGAARVYARSEGMPWSLLRSTTAADDGSYSLGLREGTFVVEAAPSPASEAPGVSSELSLALPAAGLVRDLTCPAKQRAFGQVLRPDGRPAGAGFQITATRLADKLLTTRAAYSTATDSAGIYHVIGDAGRYQVEVAPSEAALPRKIVQFELGGSGALGEQVLPTVQISPPHAVVGSVRGRAPGGIDTPVAGATVGFYSLDASGKRALFLGAGLTDSAGRYKAVLPDVPEPGIAP